MFEHFKQLLIRVPLQSYLKVGEFSIDNLHSLFEEGLYLSSTGFWHELKKEEKTTEERNKLLLTLHKYWIRSCTRCTPFATFAGSALVCISDTTNLTINDSDKHLRKVRMDMNYLSLIIQDLVQIPKLKNQLKFYTNNSLYEIADNYRYAEYSISDNLRSYHLSSIDKTEYTQAILECAKNGATLASFVLLIQRLINIPDEECYSFLDEMLNAQLLLSELEPAVTGEDPFYSLIDKLETFHDIDEITAHLKKVQNLFLQPTSGIAYYKSIESELQKLPLKIKVPKNSFQVDMFLSTQPLHIKDEIISTVIKQINQLSFLAKKNNNPDLDYFKNKFQEKYEKAEIPLTIALDADLGIGYSGVHDAMGKNKMVNNLFVEPVSNMSFEFDPVQQYVLTKYINCIKNRGQNIEINENEIAVFNKQHLENNFPNSLFLSGNLIKQNGQINEHNFIFNVIGLGGPSAGNLFGRFMHGDDKLADFTRTLIEQEELQDTDVIYAEIVHLPEARIGNILLRPLLRQYEIPYVGKSGALDNHQIHIDDIMVSVNNNEIVLRSKRLNKRIIPRLTTAHNYTANSLLVYKFLCDLQQQNIHLPCVWDWGVLSSVKQLPRVTYKNLIIKKAQWQIDEKDIDLPKESGMYVDYFTQFRDKNNVPEKVIYSEGDNELMIDFSQLGSIELFLHYLKKRKKITIEEFLFTEDNCIVTDKENAPYTSEVIIPLKKINNAITNYPATVNNSIEVQRKFLPGSEWLYFKIYCGVKVAESLLNEKILPFIENCLKLKLFEKFFFIRYKDDSHHIRIRFYNSDIEKQENLQKSLLELLKPFIEQNLIDKIIVDTYQRELERYGWDLIEESESLFFHDSLALLRFKNGKQSHTEEYEVLLALRAIDMLLNDFHFTLLNKRELCGKIQNVYFKEFGGSMVLQKQLNEKYRTFQKDIFSYMDEMQDSGNRINEQVEIFSIRSMQNSSVVDSILKKCSSGNINQYLFNFLHSHLHMFCNRLFIVQQRKYELMVFHFLEKFYASKIAISKKQQT